MRCCIRVVYLTALLAQGLLAGVAAQGPGRDPDALYAEREQPTRARQAAGIWQARLATNPKDFESAWKLSRALYWLGGSGEQAARRRDLEAGVQAGEAAAELAPKRPEGHFWMAANMGALAQSFGMRQGLRYRGRIKAALERVLQIDPAFQQGSADRALGRWYAKVPGLFGGSQARAETHLKRSLTYHPMSTASLFFLAELYIDMDRHREARDLLQQVIDAPLDPTWAPEDHRFKADARRVLAELDR